MDLNEATIVTVVLGFIAPFLISFLKNTEYSKNLKVIVAVVVSLLLATGQVLYTNGYIDTKVVQIFLDILGLATLVYKLVLEDSNVDMKLENIRVLP